MTRNPGTWICNPPIVTSSAPPIVHSTTMKVAADRKAWVTPLTKSTGDFGGDAHVVGDAVFGIGVIARAPD